MEYKPERSLEILNDRSFMREKMKNVLAKGKSYAVPGVITLVGLVVILILRGIWPFGSNRIDYFDNMQQVAPLYTHLWDWMHGDASIWFDWYTGLGTNMSMSMSAFSMLSPFNLILYLIPRNLILESISIITILKMVFMAVAMYALLDRLNKNLHYPLKVAFAVMYAFCGYTLLYGSCFTPWMDIVALFPVVMLALCQLLRTGKKLFYILMVALIFIINYYISAMILVYIFMAVGIYMLFRAERTSWKNHAWNVGVGTITGLALSAFVLVPVFMQLSGSQRVGTGQSIVAQYMGWLSSSIVSDGFMAAFQRWMMLYGMAFLLAIIIVGMKKCWSDQRERNFFGAMVLLVLIPMVVQGTNLIWHFGSYNGYTLRNGFLIAFTLLCVGAHFAEKNFKDIPLEKRIIKRQAIIAVCLCAIYVIAYHFLPHIHTMIAIIFFMGILLGMIAVYYHKIMKQKDDFNYKSVLILIAAEVFIGAYSLIGPPKFYVYEDYQYGDYVQLANTAMENLEIESSPVDRIVNPDISLNANYPLILKRGALSSFTAALQSNTQTYAKNWGYSRYFLWLLDSGGTVFSNALIHVTEAVNQNELDSELYTLEKQEGDYQLYSANYQLPFAMVMDSSILKTSGSSTDSANMTSNSTGTIDTSGSSPAISWINLHNQFYRAMTQEDTDLVTAVPYTLSKTENSRSYDMKVNANSAVYISIADINHRDTDANTSEMISSIHIYVNDEPVLIPTLGDVENTAYFTDYNNNLVYLGIFDSENVNVRVEYNDPKNIKASEIIFAQLDMTKMAELCELYQQQQSEVSYTNDSLTVTFSATSTKNYVVLPVIYSDNWKITLNGTEVKSEEIAGLFTGVYANEGENTLVMTFVPKGRREGMLISMAALFLLLLCLLINHFKKIQVWKWMRYSALFIYLQILNLVIVGAFLLPILTTIPAYIYQLVLKIIKFI